MPVLPWTNPTTWLGLVAATVLYLLIMLVSAAAWKLLLDGLGEPVLLSRAAIVWLLAQFAKYIPGNVAHFIGRVALAREYGISAARATVAITLETGVVIAAGSTIAIIALLTTGHRILGSVPRLPDAWELLLVMAVALFIPALAVWTVTRWRPGRLARLFDDDTTVPSATKLVLCFVIYIVGFVVAGIVLYAITRGAFAAEGASLPLLTGIFAVAWIVGFVTPGAPGGLGVREAILVASLGPIHGPGTALGIALYLRGVTVTGDALGFLIGLTLRRLLTQRT
jgi:uncharacterized membrane protein YbhN (UPF0104 family)